MINLNKPLEKDLDNAKIFGVCAGLSNHFNIDPFYLRVIFLLTGFFFCFPVVLYLVLAICMKGKS